jgi:hypothetical protein
MHSYDRTMIAKLGFGDSDRKNPLHDQACRYLAQSDKALAVVNSILKEKAESVHRTIFEYPIEKGQGQYKTTIGFVDLVVSFQKGSNSLAMFVEVKISEESIGNCIRQIQMYNSYAREGWLFPSLWVLASPWSIGEEERSMLLESNVTHIRLGSSFEEFCARKSVKADSFEV